MGKYLIVCRHLKPRVPVPPVKSKKTNRGKKYRLKESCCTSSPLECGAVYKYRQMIDKYKFDKSIRKKVEEVARGPNEKVLEAKKLYDAGMRLVEIAKQLEVPAGTVRRWKSIYGWEKEEKKIRDEENSNQKKKENSHTRQKQNERSEIMQKQNERFNIIQSERSQQSKANIPIQSKQETKAVTEEIREVMQHTDLTDKQQLFCISYVRCFNATKAYQKAYGVDYAVAAVSGSRLLGNVKIKEEIQRLKQERLNREFLSEADIFQKYLDIAFADITDYVEFGKKQMEVTDKATREAKEVTVNYVNLKESSEIDGTLVSEVSKGRDGIKVKLADRMKALQWLSDHMDLATEKQKAEIALLKAKVETGMEQEGENSGSIVEDWINAVMNCEELTDEE